MANYANLKATINANIKANGNEEITGPILNTVLNQAVTTLGAGYQYMGVATPATSPGTPDANVFYIAATPGTYTNFGGKVVADGEVAILKYNGSWTKEVSGAATAAQVTQLGQEEIPFTTTMFGVPFNITDLGIHGRVHPNGTFYASEAYRSSWVKCVQGDVIYVTAFGYSDNIQIGFSTTKDYASLTTLKVAGGSGVQRKTLTAPSDGYFFVCGVINNNNQLIVECPAYKYAEQDDLDALGQKSLIEISITKSGAYIDTSGSVVGAESASETYSYMRRNVAEGDIIILSGAGGASPRLCAFIGDNDAILEKTGPSLTATGVCFVAPSGAKEVIINTKDTSIPCYHYGKKGNNAIEQWKDHLSLDNRIYQTFPTYTAYLTDSLIYNVSANARSTNIYVLKGQRIRMTANANYSTNYAFIDGKELPLYQNQAVSVDGNQMQVVTKGTTKEIIAPDDCVLYLYLVTDNGNDRTPDRLEVFGLEQTAEKVETIEPIVKELREQILSLSGGEDEPYGVGDYENWESGYVYTANGSISASSLNSHTDYIEVGGADVIELVMGVTSGGASDAGICFYDSNKVFIPGSGVNPRAGTEKSYESRRLRVPDGAVYLRTSLYNEFTQYWYLKRYYSERFVEKDFFTNEVLIGSPSLHLFPAITDTQTIIDSKTAADLYAEYDAIATAHPEFLSRDTDLGNVTLNGVTYAVRAYTFGYNKQTMIDHEPTYDEVISDNEWDGSLNPRKILLVSGMHGEEHTPCWGMMLAIRDIIESDDEWAQYIKSNFIFKVIPCLNPAGWSLCVRSDSQGHVLNRDEAYNDPEATYYMDWVNANKDAFILLDCHGTQGRYAYVPVMDKLPIAPMVEKLANKLGASFFSNWRTFYESIVAGFGTTYAPFIVAKYTTSASWKRGRFACRMYEDYGMQSFAIETPDNIVSGYLNSNDLRNCKLTKDIFVNTLQFICGLPSLP